MANNRELGQFGRLVTVIDSVFVGVGTTSNQTISFGNMESHLIGLKMKKHR